MPDTHVPPVPPPPPSRPPWRARFSTPAIALVSAGVGLITGLAFGAGIGVAASGDSPPTADDPKVQALIENEVARVEEAARQQETARVHSQDELDQVRKSGEEQLAAVEAEARSAAAAAAKSATWAQRRAVAAAVAAERKRADARVRAAKEAAEVQTFADSPNNRGGGTDPRFSTCGEANDAGYGEYVRGTDPEYDWYDDRDDDGVVCEF